MKKLFGIFDKNNNYKLLRYATDFWDDAIVQTLDYPSKTYYEVHETCIPEIEYNEDYIGKFYNSVTKEFYD